MALIFEKHGKDKNSFSLPEIPSEDYDPIDEKFVAEDFCLVDVSEAEVVRHYTRLSKMNFGVDSGMYPLGSCTMKYNPKINEKIASLENFSMLHPLSGDDISQGSLQIMHELSDYLCSITGMSMFSLTPAAGAHGELAGVMMIKKYFEDIGEKRDIILIPDSAHGTNPASVTMCGFKVKQIPSTPEADVDIEALRKSLDGNVAAMMLTSPNTLGLFDRNIKTAADMLHRNGSLFYCDGANLNALMGEAKISDMGFDIMHINLHKTFSTPHGGGGPGSGPVGCVERLTPYLPVPIVEKKDKKFNLVLERPKSIGRFHAFYGNFLVFLKAYVYIRMLGAEGIAKTSRYAVLNANYLMAVLKKHFHLPVDRLCMHEFVLSDKNMENGVTTNDIAKRLLDFGIHSPTIYFPIIVPGAMMIEPTETESMESLDDFIKAMLLIKQEAEDCPEKVKTAPHTTPVKRVDVVLAARKPVLKWED